MATATPLRFSPPMNRKAAAFVHFPYAHGCRLLTIPRARHNPSPDRRRLGRPRPRRHQPTPTHLLGVGRLRGQLAAATAVWPELRPPSKLLLSLPRAGAGALGRLGTGSATPTSIPAAVAFSRRADWAVVAAGASHSCAITAASSREAYCWGTAFIHTTLQTAPCHVIYPACTTTCAGDGDDGRLGGGDTVPSSLPQQVVADVVAAWATITAGGAHACGLSLAGAAYCFGRGADGQLGTGNSANQLEPAAVSTKLVAKWADLSAGGRHTCGLAASNAAYCYGEAARALAASNL